jgi:hypothetical protein
MDDLEISKRGSPGPIWAVAPQKKFWENRKYVDRAGYKYYL